MKADISTLHYKGKYLQSLSKKTMLQIILEKLGQYLWYNQISRPPPPGEIGCHKIVSQDSIAEGFQALTSDNKAEINAESQPSQLELLLATNGSYDCFNVIVAQLDHTDIIALRAASKIIRANPILARLDLDPFYQNRLLGFCRYFRGCEDLSDLGGGPCNRSHRYGKIVKPCETRTHAASDDEWWAIAYLDE